MGKELIVYQEFREKGLVETHRGLRGNKNLFDRGFGCTSELDDLGVLEEEWDVMILVMLMELRNKGQDPTEYSLRNLPINGKDELLSVEGNAAALDHSVSRLRFPLSSPVYRRVEDYFKGNAAIYKPKGTLVRAG